MWRMSYNQIQTSFTSYLLWTKHYTLGIFVYIISIMNALTLQRGKQKLKVVNWVAQTIYKWLNQYSNTSPLNSKPGGFFCFFIFNCITITLQRSLIQLKNGGKAIIKPGENPLHCMEMRDFLIYPSASRTWQVRAFSSLQYWCFVKSILNKWMGIIRMFTRQISNIHLHSF